MTEWPELRINISRLLDRHDLSEVKKRPASADRLDVVARVMASQLEMSTSRIPDGSPIDVDGEIEAALSSLDLSAKISAKWVGECRRCLDSIAGSIEIDARTSFVSMADDGEVDVDTYPIDGDWVDVGEVVRDELMLALPLSPLCRELCEGADPARFPTTEPESQGEPELDPRWQALSQLTFDED